MQGHSLDVIWYKKIIESGGILQVFKGLGIEREEKRVKL
jgi:hypothetical protein